MSNKACTPDVLQAPAAQPQRKQITQERIRSRQQQPQQQRSGSDILRMALARRFFCDFAWFVELRPDGSRSAALGCHIEN